VARAPLLTRVLLVNSALVVFGAVAGTWATVAAMHTGGDRASLPVTAAFALGGVLLSLAVNYVVLRAAFRPLLALERTASAVRQGDLSARVEVSPGDDPQVQRLALTFNQTLDQLEEDRAALRQVASQVIGAQEEERKRISRELHDDTAQILFAGLLRVAALKQSPSEEARQAAAALEETTVDALEGVRRLALELRPPALDDLGLAAALEDLAQRFGEQFGTPVAVGVRGQRGRLPADVELVLYRVAQEALTNAAKHAGAASVALDLDRTPTDVTLSVRDDGRGFDPTAHHPGRTDGPGLGLFGMQERLALVGGGLKIWSASRQGTEVFAWVPLVPGAARRTGRDG